MVITALEADDTSTWQTRHQVEEDRESGGLGLETPSKAELENVLAVSTTTSSTLSLMNLMKSHANYTQNYIPYNLPCSCWVFMGKFGERLSSLHRDTARWPWVPTSWVGISSIRHELLELEHAAFHSRGLSFLTRKEGAVIEPTS